MVVIAWQWAARKEIVWRHSLFNLPLAFLFILLTFSFFYAQNHYEAFRVWQHWVMAILCFFTVLNGLDNDGQIDWIMASLFASGTCVALIGMAQYLFGWTFVPQTVVPAATFGNKNLAAQYVMLTLPFGLYFAAVSRNTALVWVAGLLVSLMAVFLVYTGTRGAWLACAAGFFFLLMFMTRKFWSDGFPGWNRHRMGVFSAGLLLFLVLINTGPQGFQWRFQSLWNRAATVARDINRDNEKGVATTSSQIRVAIWRNTLKMIQDNPLAGVGLGNHKIIYPIYHRRVLRDQQFSEKAQLVQVHNDYLQFIAETGLGGVIFLLWFAAIVCRLLFLLTSPAQGTEVRWRAAIIGMSLIGLAVNSSVSFPLQLAVPPFLLMVLISLLAFMHERNKTCCLSGRAGGAGLVAASLLVLAWLTVYHGQRIIILRHYYQLIQLERQANWQQILRVERLAERYFPAEKRLIYYKAEAHLYMWENRQAAAEFEQYLSYYPYSINGLRNLGVSYVRQGEKRKALAAYERYLQIIPDSPAVNAYRTRLLRKLELRKGGLKAGES